MDDQLSKNFRRSEFACRCGCGLAEPAPALVDGLQALRDAIGRPLVITSGCRCAKHNAEVGGTAASRHLPDDEGACHAADVRVRGMAPRELYARAARLYRFGGFGVDDERGILHLDDREQLARWCYSGGKVVAWSEPLPAAASPA